MNNEQQQQQKKEENIPFSFELYWIDFALFNAKKNYPF